MKITSVKWIIGIVNTLALAGIMFFFGMSFFNPDKGPLFIIYASCVLVVVGMMFVIVHFIERKNDTYQYALMHLHRYLSFSLRFLLTLLGVIALVTSFIWFLVTLEKSYFINCGCLVAFIMIIILIELFIRILLPLAGVDQNV